MVNSLGHCEGTITRRRTSTLGEEISVLDVYIVCQKVLRLVKHMHMHKEKFMLSHFRAKRNGKVTSSDHFPVMLTLDLNVPVAIPKREVNFNFKSQEGQILFHNTTNNSTSLSKIFHTGATFDKQVSRWEKQVQRFFHQSFSKM